MPQSYLVLIREALTDKPQRWEPPPYLNSPQVPEKAFRREMRGCADCLRGIPVDELKTIPAIGEPRWTWVGACYSHLSDKGRVHELRSRFKCLVLSLRVLRPWASYIIFLRLSFLYLENGRRSHTSKCCITEFTFIKHPAHGHASTSIITRDIVSRKSLALDSNRFEPVCNFSSCCYTNCRKLLSLELYFSMKIQHCVWSPC